MKRCLLSWGGLLLLFLFGMPRAEARDPRVEEMPYVQEIAGFLTQVSSELYGMLQAPGVSGASLKKELGLLEDFNERAYEFYDRVVKNTKSPWRTVSAYRDLDRAFGAASGAFSEQSSFFLDPRAFEEGAYLMTALLQFYTEPVYSYTVYGGGNGVYPRAVYSWLPSFYTFSRCRFVDARTYPWSRFVLLRAPRR